MGIWNGPRLSHDCFRARLPDNKVSPYLGAKIKDLEFLIKPIKEGGTAPILKNFDPNLSPLVSLKST